MGFLREELVNYATKGWLGILGTANRDTAPSNLAWYEEIATIDPIIAPEQIWAELSDIPEAVDLSEALDAASGSIVTDRYSDGSEVHCTPSPENNVFFATSTYGNLNTRVKNWIMPQLIPRTDSGYEGYPSMGYMVRVFEGNPTGTEEDWEIYSGAPGTYREITTSIEQEGATVGWFMNFGAGAIVTADSFLDNTSIDPTNIWIRGFTYSGAYGGVASGITTDPSIMEMSCASGALVGDPVKISDTVDNTAVVPVDNADNIPVVGVIESKTTSTLCIVRRSGPCTFTFTGLARGKKVFLGTDGKFTTSVPVSGYLQIIGICQETNKIYIEPSYMMTKRV